MRAHIRVPRYMAIIRRGHRATCPCSPSPPPRRVVRRSAGFVEFSGFPRVFRRTPVRARPRRPVPSHLFSYRPKNYVRTARCNESLPTSERSKYRVDSTKADCRACDAQNKTGLSLADPILLVDLVTYFAHSHKVLMVKCLTILPIRRSPYTHTRKKVEPPDE